jgi:hypothetical protein
MCVYWYLIFVEFLNFVYLCKVQRNCESIPNLLVSPGSGICAKELGILERNKGILRKGILRKGTCANLLDFL